MSVPRILDAHGGVIALDKPSDWATHPGTGEGPDVVSWIAEQSDLPGGLAPVHRLDKGTSGVLLCADHDTVRRALSDAFATGGVRKAYLALVHGRMRNKGVIRAPLVDHGRRQEAITRWRRLEGFATCSLISAKPEHGRRHQIRRHLQGLGHPVVGDRRYRHRRAWAINGAPDRLWLHARGVTWDGWSVQAPVPAELEAHLDRLRAQAGSTPSDR